jgi:ABC-2 type transport system permease protein
MLPASMHKYLFVFRTRFLALARNYSYLIGLSLFLFTCLIVFAHVYAVLPPHPAYSKEELLWYLALNEWILISLPFIHYSIADEIHEGVMTMQLVRPVSYVGMKIAEGAAQTAVNVIVLGIITFVFCTLWTGVFPFGPVSLLVMLLLSAMSAFLGLLFHIAVGLFSFWFSEIIACFWLWTQIVFFFGGLFVPLSAYPAALQKILYFVPSPCILGGRSGLVIASSGQHYLFIFLLDIIWIALAIRLLHFIFQKGLKSMGAL